MNLDTAEEYSDTSIWRALEMASLKSYVSTLNSGLQYVVDEGGSNFRYVRSTVHCIDCKGQQEKLSFWLAGFRDRCQLVSSY